MAKKANGKFYRTGRRKSSIARVYLVPGTGIFTINKRFFVLYFGLETLKVKKKKLALTETADEFDVIVNVQVADIHRSSWCLSGMVSQNTSSGSPRRVRPSQRLVS